MSRLRRVWIRLQSNFWFVPSLIVAAGVVMAGVLTEVDAGWSSGLAVRWPRLFGAGPDGAREMMSTIAGSMMTVVGVTFSIVLMVLALASSQYTSRILRNFMRSRVTQAVLGIFAGIFTYSLIVLRTIRGGDESFVPNLAVFFGFAMALGGVGALVIFIHHISESIQASSIIAAVCRDTERAVDSLFPDECGTDPEGADREDPPVVSPAGRIWHGVPSRVSGYVQGVRISVLLEYAREADTIVRMERGVGDFVVEGTPLVWLAGPGPHDEGSIRAVCDAFAIGNYRTVEEDAAYGIRQIVDMALKALSPGVNDTTTAVVCVDYLTCIMARVVTRRIPPAQRFDGVVLRMLVKGPSFASLMDESFDQIRCCAKGNTAVLLRVFGALGTIAGRTTDPRRLTVIGEHVRRTEEVARGSADWSHERALVDAGAADARRVLRMEDAGVPGR